MKRAAPAAPAPAKGLVIMVATRKGAWLFHGDAKRQAWVADGPHFLGHNISHVQLDPRDGRTLLAAAKTGHLGPTIFRSTDFGRTWKEARQPPAFAKPADGGPARALGRPHLLADAGPCQRARQLVRRHLAAGPVPLGGRRCQLDAAAGRQRRPAVPRVDGHGAGRHARRAEAAFGHRRSARPVAPVLRDVGRRRARVARRRPQLVNADRRAWKWSRASMPPPSPSTTRIACGCARAIPTGCTSRTTAASTGSTGRAIHLAAHRPQDAQARGRHRLSDGRASARRRHGLGLPDGRHHRLAAHQPRGPPGGLRHAQRRPHLAAAGPGPAREPGLVDRASARR